MVKVTRKPPLGSGERFKQLESKLSHQPGIKNPAALAASIGRKKYGNKRYVAITKKGKK